MRVWGYLVAVLLLMTPVLSNVDDLSVIGFVVGNTTRAYPIEIMNWHEIVNDVVESSHFAITYSPLTSTNMVLDTESLLGYI